MQNNIEYLHTLDLRASDLLDFGVAGFDLIVDLLRRLRRFVILGLGSLHLLLQLSYLEL